MEYAERENVRTRSCKRAEITGHNGYDPKKLAQFYDKDRKVGALFNDLAESQYGIKDGIIKDPTRHYFFYNILLKLVQDNIGRPGALIDIGCGTGVLAQVISGKANKYVGVDISAERIRQARNKINSDNCSFQPADAQSLPFKENSFDAAVAIEVIEHLPDPDLFMREVNRVLAKGGVFILSTPTGLFFEDKMELLYKDQHVYVFSINSLKRLIGKNGFKIRSIVGIGFKSPKLYIPVCFGSDIIKYIYKKIRRIGLKSGYGHPISVQYSVISSPLFNRMYFRSYRKDAWKILMKIFACLGRWLPCLSSNMVFICEKK